MANPKNKAIGKKLRTCRTNCSLSQQQVADSIGVERTTYTCYENGRFQPSVDTLVKLSKIFCVNVLDLLPDEADSPQLGEPDIASVIPIYTLPKDEQNLLLKFRLLNDEDKAMILDKITNMTAGLQ